MGQPADALGFPPATHGRPRPRSAARSSPRCGRRRSRRRETGNCGGRRPNFSGRWRLSTAISEPASDSGYTFLPTAMSTRKPNGERGVHVDDDPNDLVAVGVWGSLRSMPASDVVMARCPRRRRRWHAPQGPHPRGEVGQWWVWWVSSLSTRFFGHPRSRRGNPSKSPQTHLTHHLPGRPTAREGCSARGTRSVQQEAARVRP